MHRPILMAAAAAAVACSLGANAQNISRGEVARTVGQPAFADEPFGGRRNVNELDPRRRWGGDPDWNAERGRHVPDRWTSGERDTPYRMQRDDTTAWRDGLDAPAARRIPAAPNNPQHLRIEPRVWPDDAYARYERSGPSTWQWRQDRYGRDIYGLDAYGRGDFRDRSMLSRDEWERYGDAQHYRDDRRYREDLRPRDAYARDWRDRAPYPSYAQRADPVRDQAQRLRGRSMYDIHPRQGLSDNRMQRDWMSNRERMMDRYEAEATRER